MLFHNTQSPSGFCFCFFEFCTVWTTYTEDQRCEELPTAFHIAGGIVANHVFNFVVIKVDT